MAMRTGKSGQRRASRGDTVALKGALLVIADVLQSPRDRLGRLDCTATEKHRAARETLRLLADAYCVRGCVDILEQCELVARAAIWRAEK